MRKAPTRRYPARVPFFCLLPKETVAEIKRRTTETLPQWAVVRDAVAATRAKQA